MMSCAIAPLLGGLVIKYRGWHALPMAACAMMVVTAAMVARLLAQDPEPLPASCGTGGAGI